MNENQKFSGIYHKLILITFFLLLIFQIISINYILKINIKIEEIGKNINDLIKNNNAAYKPTQDNISDEITVPNNALNENELYGEMGEYIGIIRKEKIPEELELGDEYWYFLYFDEPYLSIQNASGLPLYINSMQITDPKHKNFLIDDYVNKHVQIAAYITWGYAESNVLLPTAILEIK